ncbi:MAG TPA: hypothetical protein VMY35_07570 [Phycisphaerae bacterium]|nr:hypothetical protein [Phycisphaerae bacterium]
MTADQTELLRIIRHHCQGLAGARTIEALGAMMGGRGFKVARRWVEAAIHDLVLHGYPVGTTCVGPEKGVFWIRTVADWQVAYDNIEMRFRPLAQRRRALLDLRRRKLRPLRITDGTGAAEVEVGEDGRLSRTPTDPGGQGRLFEAAGQRCPP